MSDTTKSMSGLQKYRFICGQGMQKLWVESNDIFLGNASAKFGQSVKVSLLSGEVVATEVDEDLIPRFDTEEE